MCEYQQVKKAEDVEEGQRQRSCSLEDENNNESPSSCCTEEEEVVLDDTEEEEEDPIAARVRNQHQHDYKKDLISTGALVTSLLLSVSVAFNSFLMAYQYNEGEAAATSPTEAAAVEVEQFFAVARYEGTICHAKFPGYNLSSMQMEIMILTNLIHAALLGAAAVIVYIRGDVVWLHFLQYTLLFWSLIAFMHLFASSSPYTTTTTTLQLVATGVFAGLSTASYVLYSALSCRTHAHDDNSSSRGSMSSPTSGGTTTSSILWARRLLSWSVTILQIVAVLYYVATAWSWFAEAASCTTDDEHEDGGDRRRNLHVMVPLSGDNSMLPVFVMDYSEAAHSAFLLALLQLAVVYPDSLACIYGALITSACRGVLALFSLLLAMPASSSSVRHHFFLVFTGLEGTAVAAALVASALLLWIYQQEQKSWRNYDQVCSTDNREQAETAEELDDSTGTTFEDQLPQNTEINASGMARFQCPTASQIANSAHYSSLQRSGARCLSVGSIALLVEMSVENVLLLSRTFVGSEAAHDLYKWGMHAVIMYLFCVSMAIEKPLLYKYARPILLLACPTGSIIALWQLYRMEDRNGSAWSTLVASLFVGRVLAGLLQTFGVLLLPGTQPCRLVAHRQQPQATTDDGHQHKLERAHAQATHALFRVFLPALALYILDSVRNTCTEPMISPMFPGNDDTDSTCGVQPDLMLAPNWPGLGLFFHFGLVVSLFAYDGLQRSVPTYKPSLAVACLCAAHVALLTASHFVWDMLQTKGWSSNIMSNEDVVRRLLLLAWMLASGYLALCLHRLWKLRVLAI